MKRIPWTTVVGMIFIFAMLSIGLFSANGTAKPPAPKPAPDSLQVELPYHLMEVE